MTQMQRNFYHKNLSNFVEKIGILKVAINPKKKQNKFMALLTYLSFFFFLDFFFFFGSSLDTLQKTTKRCKLFSHIPEMKKSFETVYKFYVPHSLEFFSNRMKRNAN